MLISSQWQFLLFLGSVLLGWLIHPAHGTTTDQVFDVQLARDNNGGDCDAHLSVVNLMSSEVEAMVKAATDAINTLLTAPEGSALKGRKERLRIAMMAEKLWKIKYTKLKLTVEDKNSIKTLDAIKKNYGKIQEYIDDPNASDGGKFRFACDDSWAQRVEKLPTDLHFQYVQYKKGTPVKEVDILKGDKEFDYAWYNTGGKTIEQQYMTFQNGWHPDGPCQGGTREVNGKEYEPIQAQTQQERIMIYFCPIVWKMKESLASSAKNVKKKDLLDDYRTPSSVLLHEMTHQLFRSQDTTYGWKGCVNKITTADDAVGNADTYTFFGMAMYMDKWWWDSGRAQSPPFIA